MLERLVRMRFIKASVVVAFLALTSAGSLAPVARAQTEQAPGGDRSRSRDNRARPSFVGRSTTGANDRCLLRFGPSPRAERRERCIRKLPNGIAGSRYVYRPRDRRRKTAADRQRHVYGFGAEPKRYAPRSPGVAPRSGTVSPTAAPAAVRGAASATHPDTGNPHDAATANVTHANPDAGRAHVLRNRSRGE